jgi:hypothetical protein
MRGERHLLPPLGANRAPLFKAPVVRRSIHFGIISHYPDDRELDGAILVYPTAKNLPAIADLQNTSGLNEYE